MTRVGSQRHSKKTHSDTISTTGVSCGDFFNRCGCFVWKHFEDWVCFRFSGGKWGVGP